MRLGTWAARHAPRTELLHLVQQAQHRQQPKVLESDLGRKAFGFGREVLKEL